MKELPQELKKAEEAWKKAEKDAQIAWRIYQRKFNKWLKRL